jgi:glycosyltransferase involved in cell wall biosynthesis
MIKQIGLAPRHKVAYVGTYPPQECGIATFTMDMANATDLAGWRSIVIDVNENPQTVSHADKKVISTIEKENKADYRRAARLLSENKVDLLSIQHEYGIFGGDHGEYVIELAKSATMPVVVTLHTVLPNPSEPQRRIIKELEKYAASFVVMAHKAVELLQDSYGVDPKKVNVIPHGTPNTPFYTEKSAKSRFGLSGRRVISTFGLIGPSKGIEDAIEAMVEVIKHEPRALYLVLGQTHPVIKKREGEWYRQSLINQVESLGLQDNVRFVDKYLTLRELIDYLLATDVYITPYYANPHQITSGTLAYAIATGKVVVSTPYLYAQELLAEGRGFLYPFRNVEALSTTIAKVLTDDILFESTRKKAYSYGRSMTWSNVGLMYTRLFTDLIDDRYVNQGVINDALSIMAMHDRLEDEFWASPLVA